MAVVVRMARFGSRNRAVYRVVVADSRYPKEGRNIENLGQIDRTVNPPKCKINLERLAYWQSKGARVTDTVAEIARRLAKGQLGSQS